MVVIEANEDRQETNNRKTLQPLLNEEKQLPWFSTKHNDDILPLEATPE